MFNHFLFKMKKNKNISPRWNVSDKSKVNSSVIKIMHECLPKNSIITYIGSLIAKFDDSIILQKGREVYVFTYVSRVLSDDKIQAIKSSIYNKNLDDQSGTWSLFYDAVVAHRLVDDRPFVLPKLEQTSDIFVYLDSFISETIVCVKIEDIELSVYAYDIPRKSSQRKGTSTYNRFTRENNTTLRTVSVKAHAKRRDKVSFPHNYLEPIEVVCNPFFPQQVSDDINPERIELAFSNGRSLPYVTDQATAWAVEGHRLASTGEQQSIDARPKYPAYKQYNERYMSFTGWPCRHPDASSLSNAGFFYTHTGDLVRCFQCGIGLKNFSEGDDPMKEHVRHSWKCPFVKQELGEQRLNEWKVQLQCQDPEYIRRLHLAGLYRPPNYRHPEYETLQARLATFENWPANMAQTPQQLAEAGLYYTGVDDHVRCFACDGGLRRWDAVDDPWTEHCRWFPACQFAKEQKGEEFIALVQAAVAFENEESQATRGTAGGQDLVGAMEEMTLRNPEYRAVLNEHKETCLEMGFQLQDFNEAVAELRKRGSIMPTIEEIIDVIGVVEERRVREAQRQAVQNETPLEENKRLKQIIVCMVCGKEQVNCLFLPCAHHRLCMECAESLTNCPVCDKFIGQKIRTFLA